MYVLTLGHNHQYLSWVSSAQGATTDTHAHVISIKLSAADIMSGV